MNILRKIASLFRGEPKSVRNDEVIGRLYEIYNSYSKVNCNLNDLASEVRNKDKGERNLSLTDCKELIAIMGERWREMSGIEFINEVITIYERAGLNRQK